MIDINASVSQLFLCNIRAQANQTFTGARNVSRPTLEASVVYQNVQDYDCFIFDSLSINYISIHVQVKHIAMPQRSRWSVSVPEVDIPTYLFGDPTTPLGDAHAFADAEDPETLSMTWTELRLCGIYQSANPHSNARELAYQFKLTTPHFILASQETLVCALEAAEMVGIGRERVYVFNHAPLAKDGSGNDDSKTGVKHWKNLLASTEIGRSFYWKRLTPSESKLTSVYMIMTSGLVILSLPMISSHPNLTIGSTTGLPKAAEVSHYGILANCVQTDFVMSLDPNLTHEGAGSQEFQVAVHYSTLPRPGIMLFLHHLYRETGPFIYHATVRDSLYVGKHREVSYHGTAPRAPDHSGHDQGPCSEEWQIRSQQRHQDLFVCSTVRSRTDLSVGVALARRPSQHQAGACVN
ncbi:unnamed protein product [Aspergillus oryzae]|nr:unnamed protein product [Aspergillus oryzae]